METLEIRLYTLNELNDQAKEKALNDYRRKVADWGPDMDFFKDIAEEIAYRKGFKDIELQYSLGYSQGDGVSFKCSYIDTAKFIKELWPECKTSVIDALCNNTEFCSIGNGGRYCYPSANDIEMYLHFYKSLPNLEEKAEQLHEHIITEYLDLCAELEKIGYREIEYFYSDENLTELIEINEIKFTEEGQRWIF